MLSVQEVTKMFFKKIKRVKAKSIIWNSAVRESILYLYLIAKKVCFVSNARENEITKSKMTSAESKVNLLMNYDPFELGCSSI